MSEKLKPTVTVFSDRSGQLRKLVDREKGR